MEKPHLVFFGTPALAVTVLDELKASGIVPSLIVTLPDKPAGRGMKLTPPPVKIWAGENNIPTLQPEKLDTGFAKTLRENCELPAAGCRLFVVFAYGKIIPKNILEIPKHGTINLHPSLLPNLRGPSPIRTAI